MLANQLNQKETLFMERIEGKALQEYLAQLPQVGEEEMAGVPEGDTNVKQWFVLSSSIVRAGGRISGFFAETFSEACDASERKSFQISAIIYVDFPGNCDTGAALRLYTFS